VAVVTALVVVAAAGASARNYWLYADLGAYSSTSDGINHNHNFNEMYVTASFPTGIYEETPTTHEIHFAVNGNGWVSYSHPSTYYDSPSCWNRDSSTQYVIQCDAYW
jgi:hypothetical protein